jgi:hypothetical protein
LKHVLAFGRDIKKHERLRALEDKVSKSIKGQRTSGALPSFLYRVSWLVALEETKLGKPINAEVSPCERPEEEEEEDGGHLRIWLVQLSSVNKEL